MSFVRQTQHGVTFFSCSKFPSFARHGFSTKLGGVSDGDVAGLNLAVSRGDREENVQENFRSLLLAVGAQDARVVKNHQVHGNTVRVVSPKDACGAYSDPSDFDGDGLVTSEEHLALCVFSGDCTPILFCDREKRVIAAAHAGWRGTALGIGKTVVDTMVKNFSCHPKDILVAIGPCISPCHFETHRDVPDALFAHMGDEAAACVDSIGDGKFRVDLKLANKIWLLRAGIADENISISSSCTACDLSLFWSHRVQGDKRGTMGAVISLEHR